MMDAFTVSDRYPYSRAVPAGQRQRVNYLRNSVKVVIDAYDGTTTFYVFDTTDPIIAAYRALFPALFKDAAAMPADLRAHVRYPEILLALQADVYGLYHMTDPAGVLQPRGSVDGGDRRRADGQARPQATQPMEPNFILMKLPGETRPEFVEMLPFTPANRNNLIGWIAGRSDGEHYGDAIVYDFPKTRLVDGPLQIEARIDQNAQLSGQLSLWNQQGSHVRRGALLVIPIGRGAAVCRIDLPAGRPEPDAGAAARGAGDAGSAGLRADVRRGARRRCSASRPTTLAAAPPAAAAVTGGGRQPPAAGDAARPMYRR